MNIAMLQQYCLLDYRQQCLMTVRSHWQLSKQTILRALNAFMRYCKNIKTALRGRASCLFLSFERTQLMRLCQIRHLGQMVRRKSKFWTLQRLKFATRGKAFFRIMCA